MSHETSSKIERTSAVVPTDGILSAVGSAEIGARIKGAIANRAAGGP